jgi:hypothetical protein
MRARRKDGPKVSNVLFGGLWEFLGADAPSGVDPIQFLEEAVHNELGYKVQVRQALPIFEHQLSHRIFIVRAFLCEPQTTGPDLLPAKGSRYERFKWVKPTKMLRMGLSSITQRIFTMLERPTLI